MRVGSLFSGIGGLELGLERAGLGSVIWQVESDPWCRRVLARHWPEAERYEDVRTVGSANLLPVDGICGGFPCQDVSSAGKRAGLAGARSGLWVEYLRIVRELRPRWCVVENVTSGERAWLPRVQHDLVSAGYRTEALRIGAMDVGAPHRRLRTFVLAVRLSDGCGRPVEGRGGPGECVAPALQSGDFAVGNADGARQHEPGQRQGGGRTADTSDGLANTHGDALRQQPRGRRRKGGAGAAEPFQAGLREARGAYPERAVGRSPDGVSPGLDGHRWPAGRGEAQHEWEPPRTAHRGEIPENARRLKALGNAVVPQVAELVGRRLAEALAPLARGSGEAPPTVRPEPPYTAPLATRPRGLRH